MRYIFREHNREIMMANQTISPLTGKALLQQVTVLRGQNRREVARQCGYVTIGKNGETRVNLTDFYDAVLAAKGVPLDDRSPVDGRGREASYRLTVHQNGQIVIGCGYTKEMGLKPGDIFSIQLGQKQIKLAKIEGEDS